MSNHQTSTLIRTTLFLTFCLLLTACCGECVIDEPKKNVDTCSYCSPEPVDRSTFDPGLIQTEDELINDGINVVHLGEYVTIIIPVDDIFYHRSPTIKPEAKSTLEKVDYYIRFYDTVGMNVDVYSDTTGDPIRNKVLSQARAQAMVDFMWRDNIDTRLLTAKGFGGTLPIASNANRPGQAMNRRIEINFRIYNSKVMYVS